MGRCTSSVGFPRLHTYYHRRRRSLIVIPPLHHLKNWYFIIHFVPLTTFKIFLATTSHALSPPIHRHGASPPRLTPCHNLHTHGASPPRLTPCHHLHTHGASLPRLTPCHHLHTHMIHIPRNHICGRCEYKRQKSFC